MKLLSGLDRFLGAFIGRYQRSGLPGKFWFYSKTKKLFGRVLIRHRVEGRNFWVPWDQWCFWLEKGPANYYLDEFEPFCEQLNELPGDITFLDLGADIGVVSAMVLRSCPNIIRLIAVEPNPNSRDILELNLGQFPVQHSVYSCAVSDFIGRSELVRNPALGSDHGGYIEANPHGDVSVRTVDDILGADVDRIEALVMKIDVEGQEMQVLRGAGSALTQATTVLVLLEVHPKVLQRDAITPEDLFASAEKFRNFRWSVPAMDNAEIDRNRPFYEQVPSRQYDVIGIAR